MDAKELGRKIKEARIAKKMTQSEVVGNFITRNMLSQIESGNATPSVKTLGYLSHVLHIPLSQLISDQQEDALALLEDAKSYLRMGAYKRLMEMESNYPELLKDEFAAIFARSCLELAKENLQAEADMDAMHYAQKSVEYANQGIYANAAVKSESIMLLTKAAEKLSRSLPDRT